MPLNTRLAISLPMEGKSEEEKEAIAADILKKLKNGEIR